MSEQQPMPIYAVIMAGGSGERFWPASRKQKPKQLLPLGANGNPMLEEAINRIAPIVPAERILLITSQILRDPIIKATPQLPAANVIAEPCKRNTAPCLALAAAEIIAREGSGNALMAVLTADHFIGDAHVFRQDVTTALDHAATHNTLVTLGITPTRPETGFGYIEVQDVVQDNTHSAIPVVAFREKPSLETALQYMHDGRHLWNSGMFFWRVDTLHTVMKTHLPEVGNAIDRLQHNIAITKSNGEGIPQALQAIADTFAGLPDISIDYGVMEKASNVAVVPARFAWDDVGSWDALLRLNTPNANNTIVVGNVVDIENTNSILVNNSDAHVLGVLGVDDVVVVVSDNATMVCDRNKAQDVKRIVAALRESGRSDVL